jgi:hypothetical protein|tara:strand:+ start:893 stop:1492 length:600 start_codon:yes stop_codon:yes gene_type:complete
VRVKPLKHKMSKKFKFKLNGMEFTLPMKYLKNKDWNGNPIPAEINITQGAGSSLCKQYVKKKFPNVVVSVSSNSFSMGNSVDVYISDEFGAEVDSNIIEDVKSFGSQFVYGKFNGMIDMYESKESGAITESGTKVTGNVKYLHVSNRPKFCSLPDVVKMLKDMMAGQYCYGKVTLEKAIENVKGYGATEGNINKALKLI